MEMYRNILCFAVSWLIENGIVTVENYKKMKTRKRIQQVRRACRNTPALVAYDSMPKVMQEAIKEIINGNPHDQIKDNLLESFIEHNGSVSDFFDTFKRPDGRHLPKAKIQLYYNNAIVLDAIHKYIVYSQEKRRAMGGRAVVSWEKICACVKNLNRTMYPHDLPDKPRTLERKYRTYKSEGDGGGLQSLIHRNFVKGTSNAAKIDDDIKMSLLSELLADPRNFDSEKIARTYNQIATRENWGKITRKTVENWRVKLDFVNYAGRRGTADLYNNKLMQVSRVAPSQPLYYWTVDGWKVELLYKDKQVQKYMSDGEEKERNITTYHHRLTVVVVLDPFNKYPVGFAIGTHETPALIKEALRNAAKHTEQLFGTMYRAHQIQSDKYAKDKLKPFYETMGKKYIMTSKKFGNAKAKVIEPYFKHLNTNYCQDKINWSGYGVTANKDHQPNTEFLNKYHNYFPDMYGCFNQIVEIIEGERKQKQAAFVAAFNALPDNKKLELPYDTYMRTFGERHNYKNLLRGSGLDVTIKGITHKYECFDLAFRLHAATRWNVIYDPNDLSRVLAVNDDETLRFVLEAAHRQPMALQDRKEGDAAAWGRIMKFNDDAVDYITQRRAEAGATVREFFAARPELDDTSGKLLLVDSMGQNKKYNTPLPQPADRIPALPAETGASGGTMKYSKL